MTPCLPACRKYIFLLYHEQASNIVEDLDAKAVQQGRPRDRRRHFSEDKVSDHAFELVFAFDEVITTGGYRGRLT